VSIIRVCPGPTDVEPRHHRTDTPCGRGVEPITVPDLACHCRYPTAISRASEVHREVSNSYVAQHFSMPCADTPQSNPVTNKVLPTHSAPNIDLPGTHPRPQAQARHTRAPAMTDGSAHRSPFESDSSRSA
jgi:hypothetical protein